MVNEISIIIPTLNEEKYLPKLLDSIVLQKFKGKLQVIIVDGESSDQTIKVAQKYNRKFDDLLVLKTPADLGHQKNLGAEKAKYVSLLLIDADIILPKNVLNKFTENIDPNEKSIQSSWFWPSFDKNLIHYISFIIAHLLIGVYSIFSPITSGGFMFTTKKNHREIGGFKEGVVAGEDVDFGRRSIKNGTKFRFHYDCFVYNSTRRAQLMGLIPMTWFYLRGAFYFEANGPLYDKKKFDYPYGKYE